MRNLTIKREKSFVASLVKMHVYIEDYTTNDLVINDVPCRKIGDIKNGEEKTFMIDDNPAKVFVIADKLSKNYSNEFYNLPAGNEDIFLSGKNKFNPANGNAFRFDGVTDEESLANRKKGTKKGIIILVIAMIVGFVLGFVKNYNPLPEGTGADKAFTDSGVTITLTDEFIEQDYSGYDFCYESEDIAIFAFSEDFETYPDLKDYTVKEYGELTIEYGEFGSDVKLQEQDGLNYFEFVSDEYKYFACVYKTEKAFWVIQFATDTVQYDSYRSDFDEWARTVEFAE